MREVGLEPQLAVPRALGIYLNRLSDLLFILSRVANPDGDVLWQPGGTNAEGPQDKNK